VIINLKYDSRLKTLLPDTFILLSSSGLAIHESVTGIVLHGSRGLAGGARIESDVDLSLIVDINTTTHLKIEHLLENVTRTTLDQWQGKVGLDIASVFDKRGCQLKCFYTTAWDEALCKQCGKDCFGLYKIQKGFNGFVNNAGIQVQRMYPCLLIWHRE
jgi:hypothetical protein